MTTNTLLSTLAACGGDSVPPGTFHGKDSVPPGTFHATKDVVPPGTFHAD